jgi:hypothetical protein
MTMDQRSHRHRSSSLPYAYRGDGLEFDLEWYSIGGKKPRDLDIKAGQTHVPTPPEDVEDWETVEIGGTVNLPESTIKAVFPEQERTAPPAKLYVAVQCHETIYRDRVVISESPTRIGTKQVGIELDQADFRGEVELCPYLVRTEAGDHEGPFANAKNVRVASGQTFTAVIDGDDQEGVAQIDGEVVSFSQEAHLPDGDKLYYLDFRNESRPKLWINADYPRITDVLQTNGSVGAEPRMRDVILDQISYTVWSQLITRAATAIDDDGDVEHQWQKTVVESFAREMYDTDDRTEAALALRRDVRNPEMLPEVMSRIDKELQEYIEPRTQLINLMEEGLQI